ncbi:protein kinase [Streptomyces sp. NPDC056670]|uniref:serine/threonine-protein kinase n=1 Tax=Streptomyces sp. NPDC056670 TaxID=3345904 RepID=UPI0036A05645
MGEVFAGRYELVDPVGRGGAGAVWRAWDRRRRRYVAAKVLQQSDAHTLLRFVREQALRIDHPHVLAPASWAADDDKVLFTMDLVSGGSLAHLIGDYGPLPPRFVCTLLDQLLAGLAAVHAEGVVHRDIKPANILMEATGSGRPHLRLSDFGISLRKDEPRLTETNYVVGTPGYFAPEQMMGAEPDFPADLFAVGLVALYLLEGSKPDARALVEYFAAHGTPSAPQGIPEPLWQVLAGLLQPNPQNRFRTATGARKALASAVELLPEQDPDEEPVEVFDQIGPLPPGFAEHGPEQPAQGPARAPDASASGPWGSGAWASGEWASGAWAPTGWEADRRGSVQGASGEGASGQGSSGQAAVGPSPTGFGPANDSGTGTGSGGGALPAVPQHAPTPPTQAPAAPAHLPPPYERTPPTPATAPYTAPYPNAAASPQVPFQGASFGHLAPPAPSASSLPSGPSVPSGPSSVPPTPSVPSVPTPRPGPPPKVAVPVLLVALACFAVGIWALIQT